MRTNRPSIGPLTAVAVVTMAIGAHADSAIDVISGFDQQRLESVYPPDDEQSSGELAKLIYRLRAVEPQTLAERVDHDASVEVGDAIAIEGTIQEIKALRVPDALVEFLELKHLYVLDMRSSNGVERVIAPPLPNEAGPGDRIAGVGVAIETKSDQAPTTLAAGQLQWFPQSSDRVGWQMLSQSGVDVGLLASVGSRSRRPLMSQDNDAFYQMLAAASDIGSREVPASAPSIDPVELLKAPAARSGEWIHMDVETIQITRVAVTDPKRRAQLQSDAYYQIDAMGDLGDVLVRIERAAGDDGPPATFENRYPVSIVIRELPEFLTQQVRRREGVDAVFSQFKMMIGVDAFFYRLWSYRSDFMDQHGGGEQFGPLLIAARVTNREPVSTDPAGVSIIGWLAASAMIAGILVTWIWNRRLAAQDRRIRESRQARESERLQLP